MTLRPPLDPSEVGPLLSTYQGRQNKEDLTHDTAGLMRVIQAVLQVDSDDTMARVLQANRHHIPEAVKTLQRALEREVWMEHDIEEAMIQDGAAPCSSNVGYFLKTTQS